MNIAVLSDTHGLLRPEVRAVIAGCGAVIQRAISESYTEGAG